MGYVFAAVVCVVVAYMAYKYWYKKAEPCTGEDCE